MKIPEILLTGTPADMGGQFGRQAEAAFRRAVDVLHRLVGELPVHEVERVLDRTRRAYARFRPQYLEFLEGIARGAGMEPRSILSLSATIELVHLSGDRFDASFSRPRRVQGAAEECTTFAARANATPDGTVVMGSTKDVEDVFMPHCVWLRQRPTNLPARASLVNLLGFHHYANINEAGICKLGTGVSVRERREGLPSALSVDMILDADNLDDAVAAYSRCAWASGATALVADARRVFRVEIAPERVEMVEEAGDTIVTTNHFNLPAMAGLGPAAEQAESSRLRWERMHALLAGHHGTVTVEEAQAFLRDHANGPSANSICRHDDDRGRGTIYGIVQQPATGDIRVVFGRPCRSRYQRYTL